MINLPTHTCIYVCCIYSNNKYCLLCLCMLLSYFRILTCSMLSVSYLTMLHSCISWHELSYECNFPLVIEGYLSARSSQLGTHVNAKVGVHTNTNIHNLTTGINPCTYMASSIFFLNCRIQLLGSISSQVFQNLYFLCWDLAEFGLNPTWWIPLDWRLSKRYDLWI